MTIEELKELETQTKEIAKNEIDAHANFDAVYWSANVCALINAEIARQSVTDEDVQQAIEWVKDEIADLSYGDDEVEASYPHREDEILNTILNALLSAIPKTETVGCFYCRDIESHGIVAVKTVIDEHLTELPAYNTPYIFCPNCGRKIKED